MANITSRPYEDGIIFTAYFTKNGIKQKVSRFITIDELKEKDFEIFLDL